MFTDDAADENQRKKIRKVRKIHSESGTHDFDETILADESGTHDDSSKELGVETRRNLKTRFVALAWQTMYFCIRKRLKPKCILQHDAKSFCLNNANIISS